jgi:hypothetical protein
MARLNSQPAPAQLPRRPSLDKEETSLPPSSPPHEKSQKTVQGPSQVAGSLHRRDVNGDGSVHRRTEQEYAESQLILRAIVSPNVVAAHGNQREKAREKNLPEVAACMRSRDMPAT